MIISFGIKDFIDILLVALLLFYCYRLMRNTRSMYLFVGVLSFVILWLLVSPLLNMRLMGTLLDRVVSVGAIALIVLFQDDIRRFFVSLGTHQRVKDFMKYLRRGTIDKGRGTWNEESMDAIVRACLSMSRQRIGALLVFENDSPLDDYIKTGELMDACISQRLIENIFFKNSPLHDGAMIIGGDKIVAAACVLNLTERMDLPLQLGLRHRAAIGISEKTDALVVVVSEETGKISIAYRGEIIVNVTTETLTEKLKQRIIERV